MGTKQKKIVVFFVLFVVWIVVSIILRLFSTNGMDLLKNNHLLCYGTFSFALLFANIEKWQSTAKSFVLYNAIFIIGALLKIVLGIPLDGEEILDTFCMGTLVFCIFSFLSFWADHIKNHFLGKVVKGFICLCMTISVLPSLLVSGYFIVSHRLLTSDIILTLFQTNWHEATAYLRGQNTLLWLLGIVCLVVILLFCFKVFSKTEIIHSLNKKKYILFYTAASLWIIFAAVPKVSKCYAINIFSLSKDKVSSYSAYKKQATERYKKLTNLQGLTIEKNKGGIFALIIGESETKEHMGIYGYNRNTTPYSLVASHKPGTLIFRHAYSNHTHTVPSLTFALTQKNQYNNIPMDKAYSIIELANAAGYETYWLSNQLRYSAWDTPVAVIAASAKHQIWINGNIGETNDTLYLDGKLVNELPDLSQVNNAFLVIHLMGSHSPYAERYPKTSFNEYKNNTNIDNYDNSVKYTDYVLNKLYGELSKYSNFQGIVYFSDHGEDVERDYCHESSKFTYVMSRIPLVMRFSEKFMNTNHAAFRNPMENTNAYWTNDLACDMLTDILGIQGTPNKKNIYSLASDKYNVPMEQLTTLHGQKKISDDPSVVR